jgi:hypothetical protein
VFVERRLIRLQQDASCKGVWVVTPDPEGDGIERTIWPGIVTNIRRGVSYTFVLPASKSQDGAVGRLAEVFSEANHGAKIVGIRDDQFTQLAVTDYVVINPWDSNPRAFLQVPAEPRGLWVEVSGAAALGLVKRFENMISPPADAASETPRASHVGQS